MEQTPVQNGSELKVPRGPLRILDVSRNKIDDNGLTVLASALKPPIKKLSDLHTIDISHNEDTTKVGRTKLLEARRGPRPPPGSKAKRYDLAPDKDFRIELIRSPGEDQEDPLGIRKTPLDAPLF